MSEATFAHMLLYNHVITPGQTLKMVIPENFVDSVFSGRISSTKKAGYPECFCCLNERFIVFYFDRFVDLFSSDKYGIQEFNLIKDTISSCSIVLPLIQIVVSSAYWTTFFFCTAVLSLFTSSEKRRGPRIYPWGTPWVIKALFERIFKIWTLWSRIPRQKASYLWVRPRMSHVDNWYNSVMIYTVKCLGNNKKKADNMFLPLQHIDNAENYIFYLMIACCFWNQTVLDREFQTFRENPLLCYKISSRKFC